MMAAAIATFTFTSCEDVPEPYNNPYDQIKPSEPEVEIEAKGSGIASDPFNVAAIIKETSSLADGDFYKEGADVYVTGIVTETTDISAQYGNATYYISDDAKGSNRFYVFRGKLLDGAAVAADTDLQVGDSVTVCGKIKNYKGTMEFDQGNYLSFYKKGEGGGDTPAAPGTEEKPLTVAEALTYIDGLGADKQSPVGYVKGKIVAISDLDTGNFGNATYTISDDGKDENTLQIYRGYSLGGEKFKSADEIKAGDEVIVTGKLVNYKGNTKQFAQGSSIYSLNGKKADNGGGTSGGDVAGNGTSSSPFNVAAAVAKCVEAGETATSDIFFVKGIVDAEYTVDSYKNATIVLVDAEGASQKFTAFRVKGADGKGLKEGYKIPKGATVIVSGKLVNYKGNTPETAQNSGTLISVNGQAPELDGDGGEGGNSGEGGNGTSSSPFNVAAAIAKCVETGETATSDIFFVKGIVDAEYTVDSYKNATIVLVDTEGASQKFTAFRVKGADGKGLKEGYKIPKGATVIVSGKLVNYKGNTPETAQNSGTLISVNGQAPELDGEGGEGGGGSGTTVTTLSNGNFETWANNLPTGWKSASSASSATLTQSTDAHGGSYSVNVNGKEGSNVRLASQEITLAAGSYNFSFWAKATTEDAAQVRPGYVPVTDGAVGSYQYGDYATLSTSWQQVSYDFTLTAETTVCLVVMNPKKSNYSSGKDILVDDAVLTKK